MSENTKLRPEDLTAEERAIVDRMCMRWMDDNPAATWPEIVSAAWSLSIPLILARRALFGSATEKGASVIVGSHHWFDPVIGRVVSEVITEPAPPATEKRSTDPDCGPYTHHWDFGFCHTCKKPGRDQGDAPATEKAVCPNCKRDDTGHSWKVNGELRYSCASTNKPAPPEPAAREMPEAVRVDHGELPPRTLKAGESVPYDTHRFLLWLARWEPNSNLRGQLLDWAEALEVWRRTHAAQPVAVGMTEELSMVLLRAEYGATEDERNPNLRDGYVARLKSAIETVRQQAAQGKPKVELPTARKTLEYMRRCAWADATYEQIDAALSELDAAEGRK